MKIRILMLGLILCSLLSNAQNFNKAKMDSLFSLIENHQKGMGSISIFQEDGKEVYHNSFGYADVENKIKTTTPTKYRLGSVSKTFTATVIMKLIENGSISLASKLSDFYPQIENSDKITIEHLLQHRSGIANFTYVPDYTEWNTTKHTKEQLLSRIVSGKVQFNPNERFSYSNSNYVLLAYIAEDVTSKEFADLLNELIIIPRNLKNTYIGSKINPNKNEAHSYIRLSDWEKEKETELTTLKGAGDIVSNPYDLNVFFQNLLAGKIVKPETLNTMFAFKDNFGLGVYVSPFDNNKVAIGHSGGVDGFNSDMYYFPEQKIFISLSLNAIVYPPKEVINGVLHIYEGETYQLPKFIETIELKEEDLGKYLGVYYTSSFPQKLTITNKGNTLIAEFTGQPSFPLEYFGENTFKLTPAKIELEFIPNERKMIYKQQDMIFEMQKE